VKERQETASLPSLLAFVRCDQENGSVFLRGLIFIIIVVSLVVFQSLNRTIVASEISQKLQFGFASIECAISGSYYRV